MIKTVLFDLDGTLLPLFQEDFVKVYFGLLCKKLAPLGYPPDDTVKAVWAGTKGMAKNDGSAINEEIFWKVFREMHKDLPDAKPYCDEFYTNEFDGVRSVLKYEVSRRALIDKLKASGLRLVLATNPVFPTDAFRTRLKWVGLDYSDFEYITDYSNSRFCKPNPAYYKEILDKLSLDAAQCLMIGNNVTEDMAAAQTGMNVFLVPEFLENPGQLDYSGFAQGTLEEAVGYALSLAGK